MACDIIGHTEAEALHPDRGTRVRQHHVGFPAARTLACFEGGSAFPPFLKGRDLKLQVRVAHDSWLQLGAHVPADVSQSWRPGEQPQPCGEFHSGRQLREPVWSEHELQVRTRPGLEPAGPVLAECLSQDLGGPYPIAVPPRGEAAVADLRAKLSKRPDPADRLFQFRGRIGGTTHDCSSGGLQASGTGRACGTPGWYVPAIWLHLAWAASMCIAGEAGPEDSILSSRRSAKSPPARISRSPASPVRACRSAEPGNRHGLRHEPVVSRLAGASAGPGSSKAAMRGMAARHEIAVSGARTPPSARSATPVRADLPTGTG